MKQFMLAAVATVALSLPAMAQSNDNAMQPSQGQSYNQSQNQIDPSQLSPRQIRQIQSALDQKGFNVRHVDGKWGPRTEAALKDFQQKQNLQGNGQLDQPTLAALGIKENTQGRQGSATTGSGSNESRMNRPSQNPGATNNDTTGASSPSMNANPDRNGAGGSGKPSVNDGH